MRRHAEADAGPLRPTWWAWSAVSATLVGAIITASGLMVAFKVDEAQGSTAARLLDRRSQSVELAAAAEVDLYVSTLRMVAAGLAAAPRLDEATFDTITAPLIDMGLGGATSAAFLAGPVETADLAAFQRSWRTRGAVGLLLEPSDDVDEHIFSIYSRPLDGSTQRGTGIDVAAFGPPTVALAEARTSGRPTISAAYQLLIDQDLPPEQRQTSFSLIVPVIAAGQHRGWVLMGIRGQDFLGGVLDDAAEGAVHVQLDAADTLQKPTRVATAGSEAVTSSALTEVHELTVAQNIWTIEVSAEAADLVDSSVPRAPLISLVSLLLGLLIGIVVWLLASDRERARARVLVATAELAESESRARRQADLLEAVVVTTDTVGVSVIDEDGAFLVHSPTARRILGADFDRGSGGSLDKNRVRIDGWQEHYGLFRTDGTPYPETELPLVRALGGESTDGVVMVIRNAVHVAGVQIEVSGRPIDLGDGRRGALAIFRDVTEERRQRTELAAFAGVVAHDLRNPLTAARGYVELVSLFDLPQIADSIGHLALADTTDHINRVGATLDRMSSLIDDLLQYAIAGDAAFEPRPVDLQAVVERVVAERLALRPADSQTAQVHIGPLPEVEGDPDRLDQLFANLVDNALKYVALGKTPVLDITAECSSHRTRLLVADRGIGVPAESARRLFEPFARAEAVLDDYPGTGLGLAICQRVVQAHGGGLAVMTRPGGGSIFVIDLPAMQPSGYPSGSAATDEPLSRD